MSQGNVLRVLKTKKTIGEMSSAEKKCVLFFITGLSALPLLAFVLLLTGIIYFPIFIDAIATNFNGKIEEFIINNKRIIPTYLSILFMGILLISYIYLLVVSRKALIGTYSKSKQCFFVTMNISLIICAVYLALVYKHIL